APQVRAEDDGPPSGRLEPRELLLAVESDRELVALPEPEADPVEDADAALPVVEEGAPPRRRAPERLGAAGARIQPPQVVPRGSPSPPVGEEHVQHDRQDEPLAEAPPEPPVAPDDEAHAQDRATLGDRRPGAGARGDGLRRHGRLPEAPPHAGAHETNVGADDEQVVPDHPEMR